MPPYRNLNSVRWGLGYGAPVAAPAGDLLTEITVADNGFGTMIGWSGSFGFGASNPNPPNIIATCVEIFTTIFVPPGPPDWVTFGLDVVGIMAALAPYTSVRFEAAGGDFDFPVAGMAFLNPQAVGWDAVTFPDVAQLWDAADAGNIRSVTAIP